MTIHRCLFCELVVRLETSWPGGTKVWKDSTPHVGAFCAEQDGAPHFPIPAEIEVTT